MGSRYFIPQEKLYLQPTSPNVLFHLIRFAENFLFLREHVHLKEYCPNFLVYNNTTSVVCGLTSLCDSDNLITKNGKLWEHKGRVALLLVINL